MMRRSMTLRAAIYLWVMDTWGEWVFQLCVSTDRWRQRWKRPLRVSTRSDLGSKQPARKAWFHAASVGELESLWPVILEWDQAGGESVITVFSESAIGRLQKLVRSVSGDPQSTQILYSGFSPWESEWGEALSAVGPDVFVSAKYEAWPGLWMALSDREVPLVIVAAKDRKSFRTCASVMRWLGMRLPNMYFLVASESDAPALRGLFPKSRISFAGEPRWDQVAKRASQGSPRARELVEKFAALPRPWGVLGSVWPTDLQKWKGIWTGLKGSVWIVPHRVDPKAISEIMESLGEARTEVVRISSVGSTLVEAQQPSLVLVDEMGFLAELYAHADWAFVGGGFGAGVHSTIEPAIFGLPLACGPNRAEGFPEIQQLQETGQLTLVREERDLVEWVSRLDSALFSQRQEWVTQNQGRQGATQKVISILRNAVSKQ